MIFQPPMPYLRSYDQCGFTLVEMAVVLVIAGLMLGGLLMPLSAQRAMKDYSEVKTQLEQIRDALYGYAIINGTLPCPTSTPDPADNVNYGHAAASCAAPSQDWYLPWKDLGVAETDPWGNSRQRPTDGWSGHWVYRVDPAFATTGTPFSLATSPTANLDLQKSDGTSLTISTERAVAVICSTGKDRTANGQNASFNNIYQSDAMSPTFDDVCIWLTRPQLFNRMVAAGKLP